MMIRFLRLQSLNLMLMIITFKAELKAQENVTINGKDVSLNIFRFILPEPILKDQEAVWKNKNINYTFDKESNEWMGIL